MILRVGDPTSRYTAMSYIVQRNNLFYVVSYNGHDPITGRERRRWHPAGADRTDAETMQRRIDAQRPTATSERSIGGLMSTTWLATKNTLTHPTASRYRWMIDHNIAPRIGTIRLDALRPADLDALYSDLRTNGGRRRVGLAPKTVLEIHRVISNTLDLAVDRHLIDINPAHRSRPPRPSNRSTCRPSGTPSNSPSSSRSHTTSGSTQPCTSSPTPACDAVNSPV